MESLDRLCRAKTCAVRRAALERTAEWPGRICIPSVASGRPFPTSRRVFAVRSVRRAVGLRARENEVLVARTTSERQVVLLGKIDRSPDLTGQIVTCEGRVKLLAVHGVGAPSGAFLKDSFD